MQKVLIVFGTRPEAIKMAPLIIEFRKYSNQFEVLVCITGQHREMLDQVLRLFEIVPDYDLNIMKSGQDLYDVSSRVLLGMRDVLIKAKPNVILVHGDTSTSTAAALAAFYQQIPVGHVEAGLRTWDIYSPWPEEMNRQLTSRIATYHFAPTQMSKQNLLLENIDEEKILVTGNTVIDALYWVVDKLKNDLQLSELITKQLIEFGLPWDKLDAWKSGSSSSINVSDQPKAINSDNSVEYRKLVLITGHRRENFGEGFLNICNAIKELAEAYPNVDFVYPMHLNPNVRSAIQQVFGELSGFRSKMVNSNIYFIEPLDYLPFIYIMNYSSIVLTDSGGIQEEAPGLGKPVLVMRDTTERPEAISAGTVKLVGTQKNKIIIEVSSLLDNEDIYYTMSRANNPYGDGKACEKIIVKLASYLLKTNS